MKPHFAERDIRFSIADDCLVRKVASPDGRDYTQRCTRSTHEWIAHYIDGVPMKGVGTSGPGLVASEGLPFTQVAVALDYPRERGVVVVRSRRNHQASTMVYEDAMIEWTAPAEGLTED